MVNDRLLKVEICSDGLSVTFAGISPGIYAIDDVQYELIACVETVAESALLAFRIDGTGCRDPLSWSVALFSCVADIDGLLAQLFPQASPALTDFRLLHDDLELIFDCEGVVRRFWSVTRLWAPKTA